MVKKFSFMYDDFADRLMISSKQDSDVIYGSIRILNLIIDFTTEKKVANIELIDASKYLESLKINPQILSKLTEAQFSFTSLRNGYLITFILNAGNKVEKIPYNIHLPAKNEIIINSY